MDKLIELLNEREKELSPSIQVEWTEFSVGINKLYLISKEFGFIKRLVENDKIDLYGEKNIGYVKLECRYDGQYETIEEVDKYKKTLMLLSISDTPIEDLIKYLK